MFVRHLYLPKYDCSQLLIKLASLSLGFKIVLLAKMSVVNTGSLSHDVGLDLDIFSLLNLVLFTKKILRP